MLIKYLVVTLLIVGPFVVTAKIDLPPDLRKLIGKIHADCLKELGSTEDEFKKFDINNPSQTSKCYLKCLLVHGEFMSDDEVLRTDFINKNIHPWLKNVTLPNLENCGSKAQGDKCEKSYNFFYCMHQAQPEIWKIV